MPNTAPDSAVHVAVGVIVDTEKRILISRRPDHTHLGGLWEFPGGKVEAGESLTQALDRELFEELGLRVEHCEPLMEIHHDYPDKSVFLDIWWVNGFSGEPEGREGQLIRWVNAESLNEYHFPEANKPIVAHVVEQLLVDL